MTETWASIVGHESSHEISSLGRIRSLDRVVKLRGNLTRFATGKVLSPSPNNQGYLTVTVAGKNYKLHTLVAVTFHGPKPEGMEARHLDGNQTNCAASNLAWGTHSENMADQLRHGTNHWANQTHCIHGHEFTEENTRRSKDGRRHCRACDVKNTRRYKSKVLSRLAALR